MIDLVLACHADAEVFDRLSIVHDEEAIAAVRAVSLECGTMLRLVAGDGSILDVIRLSPPVAQQIERTRLSGREIEVELCRMDGWKPRPRELGLIRFAQATILPFAGARKAAG